MLRNVLLRLVLVMATLCAAAFSMAGTLTVQSPTDGSYVGQNNQLQFLVSGAKVKVTVTAVITGPSGSSTVSNTFTPDSDGNISNSLALNFSSSSPEGAYTITVSATEPGNTYASTTVHVTLIVNAPEFLEVSPSNGAYVKGVVKIRATIKSSNIKSWTVTVNNQSIPNNTGDTNDVAVDWDTTNVTKDGPQTITIDAKDQADNDASVTINVTLDRVPPVVTITYPLGSTRITNQATIPVLIDITDASSSSVDVTGVDVIVEKLDGTYITRVSRLTFAATGSNTIRWSGRILNQRSLIPTQFKIVATCVDRAGNSATPQQVTITQGR